MSVGLLLLICPLSHAATPTPQEMQQANDWSREHLSQDHPAATTAPAAGLTVVANHDPVQHNARGGKPLKLGDKQFTRGLYCHAVSEVVVNLPAPGKTLRATVGVDSNADTSGGRGSVIFSVDVDDREAFKSAVMHENSMPAGVNVDLHGASRFVLKVSDAGDGIACDQADWADAIVTLADGREVWLGDLPDAALPSAGGLFSFDYGGHWSGELLSHWKAQRESHPLDAQRTALRTSWTDPDTKLVVQCDAIEYKDFPAVEWVLHLQNTGNSDTPLISNLASTDVELAGTGGEGNFVLHHSRGAPAGPTDYQPVETALNTADAHLHLAPVGGRATDGEMPYFNIDQGAGSGTIAVVGWPGQWSADFHRQADHSLRFRAGQELTHFVLHPGETVRTPSTVLLFYKGDWLRGQNLWRAWMIAHNMPRMSDGQTPITQFNACSSSQFGEMIHADEDNQKQFIDAYLQHGLKIDYWWMDAGWYVNNGAWTNIGTWEVDRKRFPNGLRAISDHAHAKGVKTIVWFEPERVTPGTWIATQHPDWLWDASANSLLKLGDEPVRRWLTDHVDQLITSEGIDLYRQDFNMEPLPSWRHDAPERQGISEIRHVEGYLAYWDELQRRHPGMLIDSCASGGRRNDIETLRRSVPLLRSDQIFDNTSQQNHTYGISFWIPYNGTGITSDGDPYAMRSYSAPSNTGVWDMRDTKLHYDAIRKLMDERLSVAPLRMADYYPLTPYAPGNDATMAWQFNRPDKGDGMLQAFARPDSKETSLTVKLRDLEPGAMYRVHDLDAEETVSLTGAELEAGLTLKFRAKPAALIVEFAKLK